MLTCPNDETLSALVRRSLADTEAAAVTSHLDDCLACRQVVVAVVRSKTPLAVGTPIEGVMPIAIGERVGRYVVRSLLGEGGMGAVYEAYDRALDRAIALKVLRPDLLGSQVELAERLVRESQLMAKVTHPAVITVHDVGRESGAVFIAMELIRGETLSAYVVRVRPAWRDVLALCEQAGEGLAAAHRAGIVHRDFKPDNVLVETATRRVVVTDFGVAHAGGGTPATRDGTPAYMAPEQLRGEAIDARADVFAFAVSVWQLVFGKRPFEGTSVGEIRAAMTQRPKPPSGASRKLVSVLERGLALDREARWPDVSAMVRALRDVRLGSRRIRLAAGAIAFVGLGVAGALAMTRPAQTACGDEALSAAYDARRAQVPAAIQAELDPIAAAWRDVRSATCGKPVPTACLDARALEIESFVDAVIADGTTHAEMLLRSVGDVAACKAPAPSLVNASVPADRALRRQVTQLRYRLYEAEAARDRSDYDAAFAILPALRTESKVWPRVHGEVLYMLGSSQAQTGDVKQAIVTYREAAAVAQAANDDWVAANSWLELMAITTFDEGDATRGLEYLAYAETASERLGHPAKLEAFLQYVKGTTLIEANRVDEAGVALRRALAIAETTNPDSLGQALQGLGYLYERQGKYDDSIAQYRRAIDANGSDAPENEVVFRTRIANNLAINGKADEAAIEARRAAELADKVFPPEHTDRAIAHQTYAHVLRVGGKLEDALAVARAASAELAKAQGERSMRYAQALMLEGEILDDLGRPGGAVRTLTRACEIIAFETGESSTQLAQCWMSQTSALSGLGKHREALALIEKSAPLMIAAYGDDHPLVASALVTRGIMHARVAHHALAIADLENAIRILEAAPFDPNVLAEAKKQLAAVKGRASSRPASTDPR